MAKASDILGKSGAGGFGHKPASNKTVIQPPEKKDEGEDHSITKQKPVKNFKPAKGHGPSGGGGAPTSVRPKV
jgi:hypothetical protein